MNKTIKTLSLAAVALVVIYLGYQLLGYRVNPCEGIFQQSSVTLGTKLDVIRAKGEFAIGRQKIQDLTERSQEVALNLKACCIVLGKVSSEFLRCKEGFDKYDADINKLTISVKEAEAARQQGNTAVVDHKIAEANENLKAVEARAQEFTKQVTEIKEKGKEKPPDERVAQAGGQPKPVTTGYQSVHMDAWPDGSRLRVKVNGLLVGVYDQTVSILLDPFLKPGSVNTVIFTFDRAPKGGYGVILKVQVLGSEQWVEVLKFSPSQGRLEDSFEVPFVGAKKQ